jgi:hypothetical protein
LVFGVEHISDHAESNRSASRAETTQKTSEKNLPPSTASSSKDLPKVDGSEGYLHHPEAAVLLRPRCPQLAPDAVQDQEPCRSGSGIGDMVVTKIVVLVQAANGIGVHSSIIVYSGLENPKSLAHQQLTHARLTEGDYGQDPPFLLDGEGIRSMLGRVGLIEYQRLLGAARRGVDHGSMDGLINLFDCRGSCITAPIVSQLLRHDSKLFLFFCRCRLSHARLD